jgi:hypothetical protein
MLARMRRLARRLAPFAPLVVTAVLLGGALAPLTACTIYEQDLQRSEEHFQHDEHEKALANLRALEPEWASFSTRDQARYAYLRGMTDVRLGFINDARHWLAVAQQLDKEHPGALLEKERKATDDKLASLNEIVWAGDVLPIDEPPGDRRGKKVQTTSSGKSDEKGSDGDAEEAKPKKKKPEGDDADEAKPKKKKPEGDDADEPKAKPKKPKKSED